MKSYIFASVDTPEQRRSFWVAAEVLIMMGWTARYSSGGQDLAALHMPEET